MKPTEKPSTPTSPPSTPSSPPTGSSSGLLASVRNLDDLEKVARENPGRFRVESISLDGKVVWTRPEESSRPSPASPPSAPKK